MARYVPKVDYGRLEFEYVPSSGFYRARISTDNSFKKDTDYAVVFDGRRYTVRSTANGAIGGNAYLYDQRKPDTGEPFYLAPAMGLVMASTAGFHSVSYGIMKADGNNVDERLDGLEETVVELSEEIGASVPVIQTATVGQTIAVKAVDENGKPTEWEAVDAGGGSGDEGDMLEVFFSDSEEDIVSDFDYSGTDNANFFPLKRLTESDIARLTLVDGVPSETTIKCQGVKLNWYGNGSDVVLYNAAPTFTFNGNAFRTSAISRDVYLEMIRIMIYISGTNAGKAIGSVESICIVDEGATGQPS